MSVYVKYMCMCICDILYMGLRVYVGVRGCTCVYLCIRVCMYIYMVYVICVVCVWCVNPCVTGVCLCLFQ